MLDQLHHRRQYGRLSCTPGTNMKKDVSMVSLKVGAPLVSVIVGLMPALGWANRTPQFTPEEQAWIANHPVVRTRADSNWRPFEFRENGKEVGIVPSFLDAVSRISGLRFEYVDDVTWRDSADALRTGRIDIVPDLTWRDTLNAWSMPDSPRPGASANGESPLLSPRDQLLFSRPYFSGTVFVVTSERLNLLVNSRDLAGRRIAIKGGGSVEAAIRHGDIPVRLLTYDDERDALQAVADGDADAAIGPEVSLLPLVQRQYRDKLFVSGGLPDSPYALSIATRSDMPLLASIIDKSLAAIPARDAEHLVHQWIESTDYGKPSLQSIFYYRRWQVVAGAVSLFALSAIAFISWRSRVAAVRSEREKAMFFAFISHEIRTPMHTVLSSLELLQRSKLPQKQANRANAALAASESLLTLLDDILDYSRLESRNITLMPEPTLIAPWTQRCAEMVRWRVEEKKLSLDVKLECRPELYVLIDPIRTRQIVLNLLVNALKFTSTGTIALNVDYVGEKRGCTGSLVIEVRDTGIGIPANYQKAIFEPYQRVEQPGSRRVGGSGLGLSICRELVDLMKGVISVSSSSDKGTVFTVILPTRLLAHAPAVDTTDAVDKSLDSAPPVGAQTPEENADTPPPASNGPQILVVDDHEPVQHAIQHQLDALACRSTFAATGTQALAQFERAAFDMVLLDCNLPDIDGYTVAQRMRDGERQQKRPHTPIIAISASTDDAHRERCVDSGMDGVLGKPLRLEALSHLIELWCRPAVQKETNPPVGCLEPTNSDFGKVYGQSVGTDLLLLDAALSNGDIDRARHAAHRIKGAAAIAGYVMTSELAAELERRLQVAASRVTPNIRTLCGELRRLHRADMAGLDTAECKSRGTDA